MAVKKNGLINDIELYDNIPIGCVVINASKKIKYANNFFYGMCGHPTDSLLNQKIAGIVHKENEKCFPGIERILSNEDKSFELVMEKEDGSTIPCSLRGSDIGNNLYVLFIEDISVYINTEKKLEHERDMLWHKLNSVGTIIIMLDTEGRVVFINKEGISLLGYDEKDILGEIWTDNFIIPETKDMVNDVIETILNTGKADRLQNDNHIICKDGSRRFIRWSNTVLRDEAREVMGIIASGEDITEISIQEKKLRRNEALLERAEMAAGTGSWERTLPYGELNVSKGVYNILELDYSKKLTFEGLLGFIKDEYKDRFKELADISSTHGVAFDEDLRAVTAKGKDIIVNLKTSILRDGDGNPEKSIGVVTDITKIRNYEERLKDSENRLRTAELRAKMGHWHVNVRERKFIWSEGLFNIFGYTSEDGKSGSAIPEKVLLMDDDKKLREAFEESIRESKPFSVEVRGLHKDGRVVITLAEGVIDSFDENGKALMMSGIMVDITDARNRIGEIESAVDRLKGTEEMSHTGSWELDLETGIYIMSDELCRIHGFDTDVKEYSAEDIRNTFHKDDSERIKNIIYKSIRDGLDYEWQGRIVRSDGAVRHVKTSAKIIRNRMDTPVRVRGILSDITEKIEKENELNENHIMLERAEEIASIGSFIMDLKTLEYHCSSGFYKILGLNSGEIKADFESIMKSTHPDDSERIRKIISESAEKGSDYEFENRIILPDGSIRHVRSKGTYLKDENGIPSKSIGTIIDITSYKENESYLLDIKRRMQNTEEIGNIGNWELIYDTRQYYFSDQVFRIFGAEPISEPLDTNATYSFIRGDDRQRVYDIAKGSIENGRDFDVETIIDRPDGESRFIRVVGLIEKGDSDKPVRVKGIIADITGRREYEEKLRKNEIRLKKAEEIAKTGSFIANLETREFNCSEGYLKLCGLDPEKDEVTHDLISELVHPDDKGEAFRIMFDSLQKKKDYDFTHRIVIKDGTVKHVKLRGTFIDDELTNRKLLLGTMIDITEYKENENLLESSRSRLERAEKMSLTGNWEFDIKTGKYTFSNGVFHIMGMENPGKSFTFMDMLSYIHREDRDKFLETVLRNEKGTEEYDHECRIIRKSDNETRYINMHTEVLYADDAPYMKRGVITDITDQKNSQLKLYVASERLREAEAMAHTGNWERDVATKDYIFSDEACRIFGLGENRLFTLEEIRERIHPEDVDKVFDTIDEALQNKTGYTWEARVVRPDGTQRIVKASARLIFNGFGLPVKIRGIMADVTEERKAEEKLRQSRMQLERAEDIAKLGSFIMDINTKEYICSDGYLRMCGLDPAKDKMTFDMIGLLTHPDDARRVEMIIAETMASGEDYEFENKLLLSNGTVKYIRTRGTYLKDGNGNPTHSVGTILDITEYKENERKLIETKDRLTQAEALSHTGNWEVDLNTGIYTFSDETYKIFGVEKDDSVYTTPSVYEFFAPETKDELHKHAVDCIESGRDYEFETPICRPDGIIRHISGIAKMEKDSSGKVTKVWGIISDITEKRENEQKILESRTQLAKAEEIARLGNFVLNTSTMEFDCSEGFYKVCGLSPEDKPESFVSIMMMIHPEDSERISGIMNSSISDGEDYDLEYRIVIPTGETRYIRAKGTFIKDDSGGVISSIGTFLDISDYKEAENDLIESRQRLIEAESVAKIGHFYHEYEGNWHYWSDGYCRILGCEQNKVKDHDRTLEKLIGKENFKAFEDEFNRNIAKNNQGFIWEINMKTSDGKEKIIEYDITFHYKGNKPIREIGIAKDITESRLYEREILAKAKRLARAESTASIGHFVTDIKNGERYWSDELYRIMGLEPQSREPNSFILRSRMTEHEYKEFIDNFSESTRSGVDEWETELRLVMPDESIKYIEVLYIYDFVDGELIGYSGVFRDVTKAKLNSIALTVEKDRLAQAEETAHVGHFFVDVMTNDSFWSDEMYRIFDLEPQSAEPNSGILNGCVSREEYEEFSKARNAAVEMLMKRWQYDFVIVTEKGNRKYINIIYNFDYSDERLVSYSGIFRDLTAEKLYEKEILLKTERLSKAEESSHIGHFITDRITLEKYWSDELYRILGFEPQSVSPDRETLLKVMSEEACEKFFDDFLESTRTGQTEWSTELKIRTPDGIEKFIDVKYNYVIQDGRVVRYDGIFMDITPYRLYERELLAKTDRLAKAESAAKMGHFYNNRLTGERYWSDEMYRIFGCKPQELPPNNKIFKKYMSDADYDRFVNDFIKCTQDHLPEWETELKLLTECGKTKYARVSYKNEYDDEGKLVINSGIFMDITQSKIYEAELHKRSQILENTEATAHIGHFELNVDKKTAFWSDEIFRIIGYEPNEFEAGYNSDRNFIHRDDIRRLYEAYRKTYMGGEPYDEEVRATKKSGEEIIVKMKGGLVTNPEGDRIVTGTIEDVTETRKHYDEIEYMSYHDTLTGLYNRHYFDKTFNDYDSKQYYPISLIIADVNGLKMINDTQGHEAGDDLLVKTARIMESVCEEGDVLARIGGDDFVLLLPRTIKSQAEIIINELHKGFAKVNPDNPLSVSMGLAVKRNNEEKRADIIKEAEDNMYTNKLYEKSSKRGDLLRLIMDTLYERSSREELHSERVSRYCAELGKALKLPKHKVNELSALGLLHDIGKIAVRDSILNKNSELDERELEEIKKHPEIGYRILNQAPGMQDAARYILAHHEFWNGSGYPQALESYEIPLQSRVIAITDAYDAMRSKRSYKDSLPLEVAIRELKKGAGVQFDPELTKVFITQVLGETW